MFTFRAISGAMLGHIVVFLNLKPPFLDQYCSFYPNSYSKRFGFGGRFGGLDCGRNWAGGAKKWGKGAEGGDGDKMWITCG